RYGTRMSLAHPPAAGPGGVHAFFVEAVCGGTGGGVKGLSVGPGRAQAEGRDMKASASSPRADAIRARLLLGCPAHISATPEPWSAPLLWASSRWKRSRRA